MEPLWKLLHLLNPSIIALIVTAISVTFGSAFRALNYSKEVQNNQRLAETIVTMNRYHALMIPVGCSFALIIMFYFFSTVAQFLAVWISITCALCLYVCLFPSVYKLKLKLEPKHPWISNWPNMLHFLVLSFCFGLVVTWLVSGNWILYNLIGISICVMVVTHMRLPSIKISAMLLMFLFVYDIFFVFYSERFFGANVMTSVATKQAPNPLYTIADRLSLPGLQLIKKELDLPGKVMFPENLFSGVPDNNDSGFVILGLGDMLMLSMLLALVLCFDFRKRRDTVSLLDLASSKGHKYIWYAVSGYAIGLVAAMSAAILSHASQPALLYLVPSTLGPVIVVSWMRSELEELWETSFTVPRHKTHASKE